MKLNVVLGNNFLDTNDAQIDLIGAGLSVGKKQYVIVPQKQILLQEKHILERLNLTAVFNLKVMTFDELISKFCPQDRIEKSLSRLSAIALIEMLISRQKDSLVCFNKTLLTVAFAESMYSAIMQLKFSKILPEFLQSRLSAIKSKSLREKMQDICLIYNEYERYKTGKYYDACDKIVVGIEAIKNSKLNGIDIHFFEKNNMTELEFDVFENLLGSADSVSIGVMYADKKQPNCDLISDKMLNTLASLCKSKNLVANVIESKTERPEFVQHILKNMLAVTPQKVDLANGKVEIYEAGNPRLEVEFVALDILQKIRQGARLKDFAINCADMPDYEPIFRNVFGQMHIPFWLDSPIKLDSTELGKLVLSAVDFVADGFLVKDVYRFISNSLCNFTQNEKELYENVTTCYGITGEDLFSPRKPQNADKNFDYYQELNEKLLPLFDFCNTIKIGKTVGDYIEGLYALLEKLNVSQNLNGLSTALREEGLLERSGIAKQNYKKLDNVLTSILETVGDMECDFAEFNKILRNGMSSSSINPLPISVDCVRIGQVDSAYTNVKFLYVMCAIEGNLPTSNNDVGLISDYDIGELVEAGIGGLTTVMEENSLLRQGVINSFGCVDEELCVTYPISIGADNCTMASAITSITKMFTCAGEKIKPININMYWNVDFNPMAVSEIVGKKYINIGQIFAGYLEGLQKENASNTERAVQNSLRLVLANNCPKLLEMADDWRNRARNIPNLKNPNDVFFTEGKAGVTQIEKFFDCPYAHFLSYGVKIKERKTATMQATDIGNLLHAVLEKFGRKLSRDGVMEMTQIPSFVQDIFDKLLISAEFENIAFSENNKALISALRVEAVRACEAINYQLTHSQYKIKFVEAKFGNADFVPIPEIAIINTNKRVKISGKIDRADICGSKLRIIDYKTSKNSADFKLLNFYLGKKIQLFYYMSVITKALNLVPSGAYYLPVHKEYTEGAILSPYSSYCMQGIPLNDSADLLCQDDQLCFEHPKSDIIKADISTSKDAVSNGEIILKSYGADNDEFRAMLRYAEKIVEGAINDIYSGYIEPSHFATSCNYCKFKNICRKGVLIDDKVRDDNFDVSKTAPFVKKKEKDW